MAYRATGRENKSETLKTSCPCLAHNIDPFDEKLCQENNRPQYKSTQYMCLECRWRLKERLRRAVGRLQTGQTCCLNQCIALNCLLCVCNPHRPVSSWLYIWKCSHSFLLMKRELKQWDQIVVSLQECISVQNKCKVFDELERESSAIGSREKWLWPREIYIQKKTDVEFKNGDDVNKAVPFFHSTQTVSF